MIKKLLRVTLMISLVTGLLVSGINGPIRVTASGVDNHVLKDISGHWANSQIEQAVAKGYVGGYADGTFKPNQAVKRAEFFRMLVDALKLDYVKDSPVWYQPYVDALMAGGIHLTNDFSDYTRDLSRMELSQLAMRAIDDKFRQKEHASNGNLMIYETTKAGILTGVGAGQLNLEGTTTRAEAVTIIERILSVKNGDILPADQYAVASAELLFHKTNVFTVMPQFFDETLNPTYGGWSTDRLKIENENFSAEITEMLAINLGDPKDPNRHLLPALDKMQFQSGYRNPMPDDAFVILMSYKVNYNKKPKSYANGIRVDVRGFEVSENAIEDRKLVRSSVFFTTDHNYSHLNVTGADENGNGMYVIVFPGSGYEFKKNDWLTFGLHASIFPGAPLGDQLNKEILAVDVPR